MATTTTKNLYAHVLRRPRITEKAAHVSTKNVYTFDIAKTTTKNEIMKAIKALYKVTPVAIRTVSIPRRNVIRRGKAGVQSGGKKAYVSLKKGDKIELI